MRKWDTVIHISGDKGVIIDIEKRFDGDTEDPHYVIEIQKADGTKRRDYRAYFELIHGKQGGKE